MDLSILLFAITGFFYFLIGNGYILMMASIMKKLYITPIWVEAYMQQERD